MLRRPQRTEAAQRLEARTARTFAAPLRAGVSKTVAPRAAKRKPPAAGVRARGVPQPCAAIARRTNIAAARCVRRSNARGVRAAPVPYSSRGTPWQSAGVQRAAAVVLHAVTGGRSHQLLEGSDRKRRARIALGIPIRSIMRIAYRRSINTNTFNGSFFFVPKLWELPLLLMKSGVQWLAPRPTRGAAGRPTRYYAPAHGGGRWWIFPRYRSPRRRRSARSSSRCSIRPQPNTCAPRGNKPC